MDRIGIDGKELYEYLAPRGVTMLKGTSPRRDIPVRELREWNLPLRFILADGGGYIVVIANNGRTAEVLKVVQP